MNQVEKHQLSFSLSAAIEEWWGHASEEVSMPYVSDNVHALMAEAALSVLLAVDDTQQFLKNEGMFSE